MLHRYSLEDTIYKSSLAKASILWTDKKSYVYTVMRSLDGMHKWTSFTLLIFTSFLYQ